MENTVIKWLKEAAEHFPEEKAYSDREKSLTFKEVYDKAAAVGTYLCKKDLPNESVAVILDRSVDTIAAFLGVAFSGRSYAPVGKDIPEERKSGILKTLNPSFILSDENIEEAFLTEPDFGILERALEGVTASDPLYIVFTSGSQGRPKGVITSHLSLMNYISAYTEVMGITKDDRMASQSPLDYIAAIRDIYVPLLTGAGDVLVPKEFFMQPASLFSFLNENRVSVIAWSTSALAILSKLNAFEGQKPEYIKKVCFSGSVMQGRILRQWQEELEGARFVNQYGPTETTASCTYYVIDHKAEPDEVIPIGVPYKNYKVFLLSPDGKEVPAGEEGEITVGGPGVTLGYINDPERTEAAFIRNPLNPSYYERVYKTGDIGVIREDGLLEFKGRKDRQVKYLGHRVELDEIEAAASAGGIELSAALYNDKKEQLWLFYAGEFEVKDVALILRERLPGFMVPRKIKRVDALPQLPNGKTDFTALKSMIE